MKECGNKYNVMNKLNNIALLSTPGAILLNIDGWFESMHTLNLVLAIVVSAVSLVSLFFVILKNYYAIRYEKLRMKRSNEFYYKDRYERKSNQKLED